MLPSTVSSSLSAAAQAALTSATGAGVSKDATGIVDAAVAGSSTSSSDPRIKVVVRKRPMNKKETQTNQPDVLDCRDKFSIVVREPKLKVDLTRYTEEHVFIFDQCFDDSVSNEQLYQSCVKPLVDAVFSERAKCTCFAYGQTGSGKTYTMMGPPRKDPASSETTPGLFLLAAQDIFKKLSRAEYYNLQVYVAFYEIYCGKLFDLLNQRNLLQARENSKQKVVICGLKEECINSVEELMAHIDYGLSSRTTGVTGANVDSSRSHAILVVALKEQREHKLHGKLSFIDLAGSERGADTIDQDRQTRMDGAEINKSLLALKECIRALDQQKTHQPFRGSKLTQVLKDSFIGNCRTVMIANLSPSAASCEHTLNTLRYAYRVKELRRGQLPSSADGPTDVGFDYLDEGGDDDDGVMFDDDTDEMLESLQTVSVDAPQPKAALPKSTTSKPSWPPTQSTPSQAQPQPQPQPPQQPPPSSIPSLLPRPQTAKQQDRDKERERERDKDGGRQGGRPVGVGVVSSVSSVSASALGRDREWKGAAGAIGAMGGAGAPVVSAPRPPSPARRKDQVYPREPPGPLQSRFVAAAPGAGRAAGGAGGGGNDSHTAGRPESMVRVGGEWIDCAKADRDTMARAHDMLIDTILKEEEELIKYHKEDLDTFVELIQQEFKLLNDVEKPGSDVDSYVVNLKRLLETKKDKTQLLLDRLSSFEKHLKSEDTLSKFYSQSEGHQAGG